MSILLDVLTDIGYKPRPQQVALYEHLLGADENGVVAQAGTGTGKSLAVLSAGVQWNRDTGKPSLVVVPTNVLMDQYLAVDAPRVAKATGAKIAALKGRNRYLCESASGFSEIIVPPRDIIEQLPAMKALLQGRVLGTSETVIHEPRDTKWWGCPGGEDCDAELTCHYRIAKEKAQRADVIVTNAHLLIIDAQFKRQQELEEAQALETGEELKRTEDGERPVIMFPELGVVLVDEAHTLEDNLREFATRSIPDSAVQGYQLGYLLHDLARGMKESTAIAGTADLAYALQELADLDFSPGSGARGNKTLRDARDAAIYMLARAKAKAYSSHSAVLYVEPREPGTNRANKLISTQIDMSLAARGILTAQPFGLVSATIPRSLCEALGIPEAHFVDVGHPFDYGRQATLGISRDSGSWKATKADPQNVYRRAMEVDGRIRHWKGGALLLFPSYRDLETVYRLIAGPLHLDGYQVLKQERDSDKAALGDKFRRADQPTVLFGTESFATGFDVPGDALRLVSIWKLPYPGLSPLTRAISSRDYRRYHDMMLMKVAQAAGRLIRTSTDVGEVWIADARAQGAILGTDDPMLTHFDEFQRSTAAPAASETYSANVEMN